MNKIKKGDTVIVIAGKDKKKTGLVLKLINKAKKGGYVLVEGINIAKKHVKANQNNPGRIEEKPMPIHRSNVQLYDPNSQKGSRVGVKVLEDGQRVRYFKTTDQLVDVKA